MALPLKKQWKDSPLPLHPDGHAYEMVNGIISKNLGAITNESGTIEHSASYNALNYQQLGIFNAKYGDKIVFSKQSSVTDKIGIIKADGTYIEKVTANLGFNIDYPIDCESYYNYKGQLIIAITDNLNTPKLINLDEVPLPFNLNAIQLFSFFTQPKTEADVIDNGGSLKTGAWFPFYAYETAEGTTTPYTSIENPIFITNSTLSEGITQYEGSEPNVISSKSIKLSISNIDRSYSKLIIGFISKIGGVLEANIIREEPIIGDNINVVITGSETTTPITLAEVLTSPVVYEKIKHLTQIDDVLYGAGVTESSPIKFQKYANLIKLKWTSKILNPEVLEESYKVNEQNNKYKGFRHEETYAFYVRLKLKGRGLSEAFLISGRAPEGDEDKFFYELSDLGDNAVQSSISTTGKVYQINDTSGADGKFGVWVNQDEYYPSTGDFAPVNGSEDLRGKKVRHHRFPSIRKTKELLYSTKEGYGRTSLDTLGIEVESFPSLPSDLASIIEGYYIYYAKRDAGNSTVNGQSLVLNGHYNAVTLADKNIYWGGGNFHVQEKDGSSWKRTFTVNPLEVRLHSFDLLLDKPSISPSYLSTQVGIKAPAADHVITYETNKISYLLDYTKFSEDIPLTPLNKFKKINSFKYIPNNTSTDSYINTIGEETAVAKIVASGYPLTLGFTGIGAMNIISYEETYLVNIMSYKTSVYNSFEKQLLVSTGKFIKLGDTDRKIWGGDTNIAKVSFVTFGGGLLSSYSAPNGTETDTPLHGIRFLRAFLCECNNNASLRHEIDGDNTTKYYPKQPVTPGVAWFKNIPRTQNPNKIAYNKDYSSLNDLNAVTIFSTENKFIAEDPYKIIRSKIPNKEERQSSWKTFLANDYYIIPRDKGFITNIQGVGSELFINCEQALLKTRGSDELATDDFKVVLGTGNIFERPPVELIYDKDGYAGCQHKFSCLLTRFGYIFVDEDRKKVFLATDTVKDITEGLENFFRDNLKTTGDNPYRDRGYFTAWDEENERVVLSSKEARFTRSYYPAIDGWYGKHTYNPKYMIGDRNSLFAIYDRKIYKHNNPLTKGMYYNELINPFIVVFIAKGADNQFTLTNINWKTTVIKDGIILKDKTFNSVMAWNSYQTTGELNIIPYNKAESLIYNHEITNARRVKNLWNFNKLRNAMFSKDVKFIDDIDLVPNTTNNDEEFYMKKHLSDDYVAIKLLFSNQKIGTLQSEIQLLDFGINANLVER